MRLPRSLTSRLVITTVLLVALTSVLIGTVTTLAMHSYLYQPARRPGEAEPAPRARRQRHRASARLRHRAAHRHGVYPDEGAARPS